MGTDESVIEDAQGFRIQRTEHGFSITCKTCDSTSYHPGDVHGRYCGRCDRFHLPPDQVRRIPGEYSVAALVTLYSRPTDAEPIEGLLVSMSREGIAAIESRSPLGHHIVRRLGSDGLELWPAGGPDELSLSCVTTTEAELEALAKRADAEGANRVLNERIGGEPAAPLCKHCGR